MPSICIVKVSVLSNMVALRRFGVLLLISINPLPANMSEVLSSGTA